MSSPYSFAPSSAPNLNVGHDSATPQPPGSGAVIRLQAVLKIVEIDSPLKVAEVAAATRACEVILRDEPCPVNQNQRRITLEYSIGPGVRRMHGITA